MRLPICWNRSSSSAGVFHIALFCITLISAMPRRSQHIEIPSNSIGIRRGITVHHYGQRSSHTSKNAYIQASLHADEIPGMLVAHHLIHLLDAADKSGLIQEQITIVPFANPIGLSQQLLGSHVGRFSLETGVNFNRGYRDLGEVVAGNIANKLSDDSTLSVEMIRDAIAVEIDNMKAAGEEAHLKKILLKLASSCDIVLDLHCDSDAVLHMYTHSKLWPNLADLAAELGSECHLLAVAAGGFPFDDACSCSWAYLAEKFPSFPIPMACESATVELRGESDVSDELALRDARSIFRFLQRRGYIAESTSGPDFSLSAPPVLKRQASDLSAVDMVEAATYGVVAWSVRPGAIVCNGQLLGEIVNIENPDAERTPVLSRTDGILFSMARSKLVRPGQVIAKVAGSTVLDWRTGNLLTS